MQRDVISVHDAAVEAPAERRLPSERIYSVRVRIRKRQREREKTTTIEHPKKKRKKKKKPDVHK